MSSRKIEIYLIIDESGAKGFSDKNEEYQGEFGIITGFIVPGEILLNTRSALDTIKNKFVTMGKAHITDMTPEQQTELRNSIYEYFSTEKLSWLYEAIYVQGFVESEKCYQNISTRTTGTATSKVRISGNNKKERLLSVMFQGVLAKALAYCEGLFQSEFKLIVITDRQDKKISDSFHDKAKEYINVTEKEVVKKSGYNSETKEVLLGSITFEIGDESGSLSKLSKIPIIIREEDSSLTLVADVLANTTHYILKKKVGGKLGIELNSFDAISDHPLKDQCYGSWLGDIKDYADLCFPYPSNDSGDVDKLT